MLRTISALALGFALLGLTATVTADDKPKAAKGKEVTLEGDITCAKCGLKVAKACATVIKVDDKVYYFDQKGHKKYHGDTCTETKAGKVTGVVKEEKGKNIITVSKVEYK